MTFILPSHGADSLVGQLLIASPALSDSCFDRAVVYLCDHGPHGAMGVIINRPIANLQLGELLESLDIPAEQRGVESLPVYFGGPVDAHRGFILHSTDYITEQSMVSPQGLAVTANVVMLKDMARGNGPNESMLVLGYAGWTAGQLEAELESGSWHTAPATKELVFHTDNEMKWAQTGASLGVDMSRLSFVVGHA